MGFFHKDAKKQETQKRQAFRMPVAIQAEIFGPSDTDCIHGRPCTISDLSGGGASLKSSQPYGKQVTLKLRILLPEHTRAITLPCRVLRSTLLKSGYYQYAVQFSGASERDTDAIVRYLFDLERRKRDY